MSETDKLLSSLVKESSTLINTSDLIVEVFKDLAKDEMKTRIRDEVEKNPELKAEIKAAVKMYMDAKVKEMAAGLRLAKCAARLGLDMMPDDVRENMIRDLIGTFEREINVIIEKAL